MRKSFAAVMTAVGVLLGASDLLGQDSTSGSILPNYPTSKRQVVAQQPPATGAGQSTTLKWGVRAKPNSSALPQRSTIVASSEVPPVSMNLRVGTQAAEAVTPAVVLVPAETLIAPLPDAVRVAQSRSRFEQQPTLDPPDSLTAPDAIDVDPGFSPDDEPAPEPALDEPLAEEPPLDTPAETDPAPSELPPLDDPLLPDPGAARNFGEEDDPEETPCREKYRDTNCCEQNNDCRNAWQLLERNPVRGFAKGFLDITPLYRPDVRYSGAEQVDQEKARELGLAINALRAWKNTNGKPLGLAEDGTVLGLDGEDWEAEFERAERAAELDIGGIRPTRPIELKGRATNYKPGAKDVTVVTEVGDELSLPLAKLSLDDNEWINGRPWRDAQGRLLARGRFHDYEWNRILVMQDNGRVAVVPLGQLGENDLCYVGAYWGEGVGLPAECLLRGTPTIRNFTMITYTWKASGLCHKPLYFEEVQLERYGHTFGPVAQPVISGAHFFANIAILPYKMGIHPKHECQYSLGYYRPGDCAPYMLPLVPLSVRGGLYEAGAVVGAVALFP